MIVKQASPNYGRIPRLLDSFGRPDLRPCRFESVVPGKMGQRNSRRNVITLGQALLKHTHLKIKKIRGKS